MALNKFLKLTLLSTLIVFVISCNQEKRRPDPQEIFNEKTPGRKVMQTYQNNNPQLVYFYEVDENKKVTDNKIGEMLYRDDKSVYMGGGIKNNKKDGVWKAFYPDGKVQTDAFFIDGKEDGEYTVYYDNGTIRYTGSYKNGICEGTWKFYTKGGTLHKSLEAKGENIVCGSCPRCIQIAKTKKQ
ncbi:MAG: toxin-antitoxin system YwqK family antitoxin [Bacteroidetes bacterium]|nr:toxin-antitoxin system YwqK family antitoxin [Bacteroidota bacterium]